MRAGRLPASEKIRTGRHGLSKLNSVRRAYVEVDVFLGELGSSDDPEARSSTSRAAYRSNELRHSLERR